MPEVWSNLTTPLVDSTGVQAILKEIPQNELVLCLPFSQQLPSWLLLIIVSKD